MIKNGPYSASAEAETTLSGYSGSITPPGQSVLSCFHPRVPADCGQVCGAGSAGRADTARALFGVKTSFLGPPPHARVAKQPLHPFFIQP